MKRMSECPDCHRRPLYYPRCDTFGCPDCDKWTESPHCAGRECRFEPTPERPSLYKGEPEDIHKKYLHGTYR